MLSFILIVRMTPWRCHPRLPVARALKADHREITWIVEKPMIC